MTPPKTPLGDQETAVAYIRVSTTRQDLGPEAQRAAIEAFAAARNIAVVAWFEDRCSGTTPVHDRPGLLDAMNTLRGRSYLLAHKRDRLARDVGVAFTIERMAQDARAVVLTTDGIDTSDAGVLVRQILDAVAQYEHSLIRARVRAALRAKVARGEKLGREPFELTSKGIETKAFATGLRLAGNSHEKIAEMLNRHGYTTAFDKPWTPRNVKKLLLPSRHTSPGGTRCYAP